MGNFNRRNFNNRGSNRPIVMHKATCGRCGKECEVPFRPTNDRPVFCSSCFENNRGDSNFEDKRMFDATCDNCGNSCKVPFQPRGDKPIYCSNCFGEKKGAGSRENGQSHNKEQFEVLNNKLDKILQLLDSSAALEVEEELDPQPQEEIAATKKTKVVKKRSPKKSQKK